MKNKIAIGLSYVLAVVAIVISLWRCEPFTIDTVAVLANILALMVTILLGVIAYNYFIQKEEIKKYKEEIKDGVFEEVMDVYVNLMSSFAANKNGLGLFPLGVKVLERLDSNDGQNISEVCTLLSNCYAGIVSEDKSNPVIKACLSQLSVVLKKYTGNPAAMQLLATIENE